MKTIYQNANCKIVNDNGSILLQSKLVYNSYPDKKFKSAKAAKKFLGVK